MRTQVKKNNDVFAEAGHKKNCEFLFYYKSFYFLILSTKVFFFIEDTQARSWKTTFNVKYLKFY